MISAGTGQDPDPLERLAGWRIPAAEQVLAPRDCMLYGLSVGLGRDPTDARRLKFVSEFGTSIVPSMVLTLAAPGFWFKAPELGLGWANLLNVEQSIRLERLPAPGSVVRSVSEVVSVVDKGAPKGAVIGWRRDLFAADGERAIGSVTSTVLLRGDGRRARVLKAGTTAHVTGPVPNRPADASVEVRTDLNSGLLYRLNGTLNPLHADPETAKRAGFPRPIMPGTASLGFACAVLLEHLCAFEPAALATMGARLTAPVYPGDVLRHELWTEGASVAFRVTVPERKVVVLDQGRAELRGATS